MFNSIMPSRKTRIAAAMHSSTGCISTGDGRLTRPQSARPKFSACQPSSRVWVGQRAAQVCGRLWVGACALEGLGGERRSDCGPGPSRAQFAGDNLGHAVGAVTCTAYRAAVQVGTSQLLGSVRLSQACLQPELR